MTSKKRLTNKELIEMAKEMMTRMCEIILELDEAYYTSSDLILYSDDWTKYVDGEIENKDLEERIKNLRLFTTNICSK